MTRERLGEQKRSLDVRIHHRVPKLWRRRLEVAAREAGRRRVDEEVDRAELGDGIVHNFRRAGLAVRQIDGYEGPRADSHDLPMDLERLYFACDSGQCPPATRGIPSP